MRTLAAAAIGWTAGLGAPALAEGDAEYGEYLAAECVACHHAEGRHEGIPAIDGWPPKLFVEALQAYKSKARPNPVMQTVAASLDDEMMAALAAYYETLEPR